MSPNRRSLKAILAYYFMAMTIGLPVVLGFLVFVPDAVFPTLIIGIGLLVVGASSSLRRDEPLLCEEPEPHCCSKCNYLLAGLPSPICPECGCRSDLDSGVRDRDQSQKPRPGHVRSAMR